jgi:hypothetical protein
MLQGNYYTATAIANNNAKEATIKNEPRNTKLKNLHALVHARPSVDESGEKQRRQIHGDAENEKECSPRFKSKRKRDYLRSNCSQLV